MVFSDRDPSFLGLRQIPFFSPPPPVPPKSEDGFLFSLSFFFFVTAPYVPSPAV